MKIVPPSPESGAKSPSAIQWKAGNQVEEAQLDVHDAQEPSQHNEPFSAGRNRQRLRGQDGAEATCAERKADGRACNGDEKFRFRTWRLLPHLGYATEEEQRDLADGYAIALGHIGMPELV